MSSPSWLHNIRSALAPGEGHRGRRHSRRTATHRPKLEVLEDRRVPAFLAPVDYAVGDYPLDLKAGDFNNDGRFDLVTVNLGSDDVSVLLGNADGTFQPALNSATSETPISLAVGDFDADGNLDLATANGYGNGHDVDVLMGNGDGTFQPPTSIPFNEGSPKAVAVGDFNGDGLIDLGVMSEDYPYYYGYGWSGKATVLLGNGEGSFSGTNATALGVGDHSVAVAADLNGDDIDDFVTVESFWYRPSAVYILSGDSSGQLQGLSYFYAGSQCRSVAAGDLDADGDLDLVTGSIGSDKVGVSLNNGAGGFGAVGHYSAGGNPAAVALGDFTGDGKLDVAAGNEYNTLSVLPGRGDGMLSLWINFGVGGGTLTGVAAGDFNGDGWLDVATASNNFLVSVLLNDSIWDGLPPPPVPPTLRIGDVSLTEGNSGTRAATFTVTLSAPSAYPVTVQYATANGTAAAGSDYQAWSGILSIPAGSTTGTITVPVIGDRLPEPNETFTVNLSSPTNATIDDGQGIGTILDNEPRISISDVSKTEGNGKKSTLFTFTVTLSAAYDQPVTVSFQTVNGTATTGDSDYVARTGMLTFAPGETTKTITIDVKSDRKTEADEYFYLDLSGNSSNSLFIKSRGLGTILNDD